MRIPVLSYRPMHIDGNDYRSNDICALAHIRHLTDAGYAIVPRARWWTPCSTRGAELERRIACLTTYNGADFNFRNIEHPRWGMQRGIFHVLRDFARDNPGGQPRLNVTAFSIVSPGARGARQDVDDRQGLVERRLVGGSDPSGLLHIGNHSWDHNHETSPCRREELANGNVRTNRFPGAR